jgi:hypothetical protein
MTTEKKTLLVADTKAKKLVTGLVDVHEAMKLAPDLLTGHLEIVHPTTHLERLARFARKDWKACRDHLTRYVNRLGWLTPDLLPAG